MKKHKIITEAEWHAVEMYQTPKNVGRVINSVYKLETKPLYYNNIYLTVLKEDIKDFFKLRWLKMIFKRIKQLIQFILIGKQTNKKKRKEDYKLWKKQQTSWTPGSTIRNS